MDEDIRVVGRARRYESVWHWLVLHDATEQPARVYQAHGGVDTICGIAITSGPTIIDLRQEQTPDEPDCGGCETLGLPRLVFDAVRDAIGALDPVTA